MSIQGPGIWSFHKNILDNPVLYFYSLMKEFGNVVRCRSLHDIYLISHPEYARRIFQHHAKSLTKEDDVNARLKHVIGDGVVVSSGNIWRSQRQRAQVNFQKKELQNYVSSVTKQAESLAINFSAKKNLPIQLHDQLSQHLLRVLLKCLFNEEDAEIKAILTKAFASGYEYVSNTSFINFPDWIPFTKNYQLIQTSRNMDRIILSMQQTNLKSNRYEGTLLDRLMKFRKEDGSCLSPEQITDEAKNILAAGHFSTTDLLCWMMYSLARYPEWQFKIREELVGYDAASDFQGVLSLHYFIHEVMRCYPPVWSSWHKTQQPIPLDSFTIPAGKTILISFFNVHRNPDCWEDPDAFNPMRFANGSARQDNFMPFGFGQRKCLGMGLANMIIVQTIAQIVRNVDLKLDPTYPAPKIQSRVTLGSSDPLRILASPLH
jgi:enediyne biosynthesis protein E7